MPTKTTKKQSKPQKDQILTLQLSPEITNAIIDLSKKKPEQKGFWSWLKEHGTSLITLFTIISAVAGGLWTLNQYVDQQRQSEQARQQEVIARFAGDLADPEKRNSAVYALAVLANDEVVPLLVYQLQEVALNQTDVGYQNALTQALITIGEPAIVPVIDLNKRVVAQKQSDKISKISEATSPILGYFIANHSQKFQENKSLLEGVLLTDVVLSGENLGKFQLTKFGIENGLVCVSNFKEATLTQVSIMDSDVAGSIFSLANLRDVSFSGSNLAISEFKGTTLQNPFFISTNLSQSRWTGADITGGSFQGSDMRLAYFDQAKITGVDFSQTKLANSKFFLTKFNGAHFNGADLSNVDFRGADLTGVEFYFHQFPSETPDIEFYLGNEGGHTSGAFVRDADFEGATNLSDEMRIYLCKWGAKNVPGGCDDIEIEDLSMISEVEYDSNIDLGKCGN